MTSNWSKRLLAIVLCVCMMLPSIALAETVQQPVIEIIAEPAEETSEEVSEEPVEEPTVEPTEEPTAEPTETPTEEPTVEPTEAPAEDEPVITPEEDGSDANVSQTAVKITTQPKSVTVPNGATATVTVKATGTSLKYQWYYKNASSSSYAKSGVTSSTYSTTMNSSSAGRQVYCIVTDSDGSEAMTNIVTLSMGGSLKITKQPASVKVLSGQKATVSVTASGEGLSYQWYYKNAGTSTFKKSSVATSTYTTTMDSSSAGRSVYCLVNDKYGNSVKSSTVTLSMGTAAKITKQPASVTAASGETVTISVTATGDGLSYQWYYKNVSSSSFMKSSVSTRTYTTTMNSSSAGRKVYCIVKDQYGTTLVSSTVTLNMSSGVKITKQPASVKVLSGQKATVSVTASGEGLSYQWYYKNAGTTTFKKSSVSTRTYITTMNSSSAGRSVYCLVTDKYGNSVKSSTVTLSMGTAAKITKQPASVTAASGTVVKISVTATGDGLSYQWYYKNVSSSSFMKSSVSTSTYTTTMNSSSAGRQVYCIVKDQYGTTLVSSTVTLSMSTGVTITKQPVSVKVLEGQKATVSVTASGEGLSYQWYYKNAGTTTFKKSSVATSAYTTTMNSSSAGRSVYCLVTDKYGNSAKSSTVTLTMGTAAKITAQPVSVSAADGESVTISVTAVGDGLSYQWYYKNASASAFKKSSVSTRTYTTTLNSTSAGRQVYCVVTDQYGTSVTSNTVTLEMETGADDFTYSISNGAVTITGYTGNGGSVAIPSTIEGYPVTAIGGSAFKGNETITAVTIPGSVQTISASAFANCILLRTLNLSEGLKTIGGDGYYTDRGAFYNCVKLTSVTIPSTVTTIVGHAFFGCELLSSLTIKSSSSYKLDIQNSAFNGTILSGTLTIPANVSGIGDSAFYGTSITALKITAGNNLKSIGQNAFKNCEKLASVSIPGNVETINNRAFANCILLRSLTLSEGLKTIGGDGYYTDRGAFYNCVKLTSVTIPSTVTTIAGHAFFGCELLSSLTIKSSSDYKLDIQNSAFNGTILSGTLTIPAKVSGIGDSAFYGTPITALKITAGTNLKSIGANAFKNCEKLTTVTIPGNVETINNRAFANCVLLNSLTLNEGLKTIGGDGYYTDRGAFYNCVKLTSVTIPSTVTTIVGHAFFNCTALSSLTIKDSSDCELDIQNSAFNGTILSGTLTIPAKVSGIGDSAFTGTPITALKITAGNYLKTIGANAFKNCTKLTTVTIPGNVETISNRAFANCVLLKSLTLNEGLKTIGGDGYYTDRGAFYNCVKLTSVTIPSTVTTIVGHAFFNCTALSSLTIKSSSDYELDIQNSAFNGTALTGTLTIPAKVQSIGDSAFYGTSITSLKITAGNYLKTIGANAFKNCAKLTNATIPGNVETISNGAFANCILLSTVTLNEGLKTIGGDGYYTDRGAFYRCLKLTSITIPSTVTSIGGYAFNGCSTLSSIRLKCSSSDVTIGTGAFSGCPGIPMYI